MGRKNNVKQKVAYEQIRIPVGIAGVRKIDLLKALGVTARSFYHKYMNKLFEEDADFAKIYEPYKNKVHAIPTKVCTEIFKKNTSLF